MEFDDKYWDDNQKMFSDLGTIEAYRPCPDPPESPNDNLVNCPVARGDHWTNLPVETAWFVPTITLSSGGLARDASMQGIVKWGVVIVGWCLGLTTAAFLVIGAWRLICAWVSRWISHANGRAQTGCAGSPPKTNGGNRLMGARWEKSDGAPASAAEAV